MGKFLKSAFSICKMLEKLYINYSYSCLLVMVWEMFLSFFLNTCHFTRPHYSEIVLFIQVGHECIMYITYFQ